LVANKGSENFSLCQTIQNGFGTQPGYCTVDTKDAFSGNEDVRKTP